MRISLDRVGGALFEARNESGQLVRMDGPADVGGQDLGLRPMELLLASLAGCSAVDVLHILGRMRLEPTTLRIEVDGHRVDAIPAVYDRIHLRVQVGGVPHEKAARALALSLEKYCSVAIMLKAGGVSVTGEVVSDELTTAGAGTPDAEARDSLPTLLEAGWEREPGVDR